MKVSENGKQLIIRHEGIRLEPYLDSVGIPTIGIGNTFYEDGTKVTMEDPPITQERVYELFDIILKPFEDKLNELIKVEITQNMYDACLDLIYNIGAHNFANSTLLKLLNEGNYKMASEQFEVWDVAAHKVIPGLEKRRLEEKTLFLS